MRCAASGNSIATDDPKLTANSPNCSPNHSTMAILNHRLTDPEYARNFGDIHPPFETRDAALTEANRCLFCYDAPWTKRCPTGIDVPKFIQQITTDNLKGSAHTILQSNIMGGGCSKV